MTDHHDDRSRGEKVAENTLVKLFARFSMPICTIGVAIILWAGNTKVESIYTQLSDIKTDIASVKNDVSIVSGQVSNVRTSDAVQNAKLDAIDAKMVEQGRRLNRIEQKVFP